MERGVDFPLQKNGWEGIGPAKVSKTPSGIIDQPSEELLNCSLVFEIWPVLTSNWCAENGIDFWGPPPPSPLDPPLGSPAEFGPDLRSNETEQHLHGSAASALAADLWAGPSGRLCGPEVPSSPGRGAWRGPHRGPRRRRARTQHTTSGCAPPQAALPFAEGHAPPSSCQHGREGHKTPRAFRLENI